MITYEARLTDNKNARKHTRLIELEDGMEFRFSDVKLILNIYYH